MDQEDAVCPENPLDQCDNNPNFAIICSFIKQFGVKIDLKQLNIEQLRSSIEDRTKVDDSLIDIHVRLIKKVRGKLVNEKWERALIEFAEEVSYNDAYEIQQLGYAKIRPSLKLELLRRLLEAQFECDQKFKTLISSLEADELRPPPTGRDVKGNRYWHYADKEGNLRIFSEEPMEYESWKVVCKTPADLNKLIERLEFGHDVQVKEEPEAVPQNVLPGLSLNAHINSGSREECKDLSNTTSRNETDDKKSPAGLSRVDTAKDNGVGDTTHIRSGVLDEINENEETVKDDDYDTDATRSLTPDEDSPCKRCGGYDEPECILLCDGCDDGYHMNCCIPPLIDTPDGDWFCPPCEQKKLITRLKRIRTDINRILKAKAREQKRREHQKTKRQAAIEQRLKDEIIPENRRLNEPAKVSYIEDEVWTESSDAASANATSDESFKASSASETEEEEDEEEFIDDEEDITEDGSDEESSYDEIVLTIKRSKKKSYLKGKKKKKRRKIYHDSDESDDSEFQATTRRAAAKQVSYKESTDEDELSGDADKPFKQLTTTEEDSDEWKESDATDDDGAISDDELENLNETIMSDEIIPPKKPEPNEKLDSTEPEPFYRDDEVMPPQAAPDRPRPW